MHDNKSILFDYIYYVCNEEKILIDFQTKNYSA